MGRIPSATEHLRLVALEDKHLRLRKLRGVVIRIVHLHLIACEPRDEENFNLTPPSLQPILSTTGTHHRQTRFPPGASASHASPSSPRIPSAPSSSSHSWAQGRSAARVARQCQSHLRPTLPPQERCQRRSQGRQKRREGETSVSLHSISTYCSPFWSRVMREPGGTSA